MLTGNELGFHPIVSHGVPRFGRMNTAAVYPPRLGGASSDGGLHGRVAQAILVVDLGHRRYRGTWPQT
jgi:hypothetical protein